MRRLSAIILCLIMSISMLFACSPGNNSQSSSNVSEKDGVLNIAGARAYESSREGASLVFDTLTELDEYYHAIPSIVSEWKAENDSKEYDLTIRDGIKFHDGTELTVDIVKWNIENGGAINYCGYSYLLDKVEVTDKNHIRVSFTAPYLYFDRDLALVPCVKPDGYTEEGTFKDFVGTGPFKFESKNEGDVTVLTRNKDYWNSEYKTDIEKVQWYYIKDAQTRKLALESGQADVLGLSEHGISIPYTVIDELIKNDKFDFVKEDDEAYTSTASINTNWKKGKMSDVNLRRAFETLFDREVLVKDIFLDVPKACGQIYNPKFDDGPKNENEFTYSEEKFKSNLEKAGYTVGDISTPTTNKSGEALVLKLLIGDNESEKDLAVYMQELCKKWGITINIESMASASGKQMIKDGDYDLVIGHPWFVPLVTSLGYMGLSSDYMDEGLGFCINDEMKKAGEEYMSADSSEKALKYSDEIWKIQYDQAVSIPLYANLRYAFYNKKFEGFHFNSDVFKIDLNGVKYR